MRTKKRLPFYLIGTVLLFILLASCEEKPDFVGKDLLPSGDDFVVLFDSLEVVQGYTKLGDSIPSGYKELFLLGSIKDPFFGISKSEIVTTIMPSSTSKGFGTDATADSVVLILSLPEIVGEGIMPQVLRMYEYTEYIGLDTIYYTDMDITGKYNEKELGFSSISPGDSLIKLFITDSEIIKKFFDAEDSVLRDGDHLQHFINGFYFTTDDISDDISDDGIIAKIDFDGAASFLYFFYTNADSIDNTNTRVPQTQYYSFQSTYNRRINLFSHQYEGYDIGEFLNNGSKNDSLISIQSMAGVSSVIRFPEVTDWLDSMPVAINQARLIFSMADTNVTEQNSKYFPENLSLYAITEDGRYSLVYDNLIDVGSYGGSYDSVNETYSFTIKIQIQSILKGDIPNLDLLLVPVNPAGTVKRAVLNGWSSDPQKRIRLEITYTKL